MTPNQTRSAGRGLLELRPIEIQTGVNRYAEGSSLIKMGNTHVLCTASVEQSVPSWLMGRKQGWVTADYSMLPRSTHTRSKRDREKVSGRTLEIQRLIARALRTTVNLAALGEISIMVDCDVLQADGGTRTASITGGSVALAIAIAEYTKTLRLPNKPWIDTVAAISVGIRNGTVLVDLDYDEDSTCDVDMNIVMTGKGKFVEIQGTAEKEPFDEAQMASMTEVGSSAIKKLREIQLGVLERVGIKL